MVLLLGACDGTNVIGPENQPEINNNTDNFQWQVTALDNVSQTLTYPWETTGANASVNQSSSMSGGSATLLITDADGTQVYSGSLADNGTFPTATGTAGTWTIEVTLSGVSGTLNFRVETP
jgi:hypothetical protein